MYVCTYEYVNGHPLNEIVIRFLSKSFVCSVFFFNVFQFGVRGTAIFITKAPYNDQKFIISIFLKFKKHKF